MAQHVALTPTGNREDWDDTFELFDVETGDALDLTGVTALTLVVWDPERPGTPLLAASLGDGIAIDDVAGGVISIHFDAGDMAALCARSYALRLGMVNGGARRDLMLGTLPVEDGGPN